MTPALHAAAFLLGGLLDLLIGDPHGFYHPVRAIGALISRLEGLLRRHFPATPRGELAAGILLDLLTVGVTGALAEAFLRVPAALLGAAIGTAAGTVWRFFSETFLITCLLAARSLRDESMKVYDALEAGDLPGARHAVSMIVGRDTESLDEQGVIRACVETVAEGTSDGVIAPLFFLALGGPVAGWMYKAVNTMDSMVGYRNERYLWFGKAAARTDDVVNFLPSRIAGLLLIASAGLCRLDAGNAWKAWRRDRRKHLSPNSAQTEAACAGALGLALGGDSRYSGKIVHKPVLGDPLREPENTDIRRADRLMLTASVLGFFSAVVIRAVILFHLS